MYTGLFKCCKLTHFRRAIFLQILYHNDLSSINIVMSQGPIPTKIGGLCLLCVRRIISHQLTLRGPVCVVKLSPTSLSVRPTSRHSLPHLSLIHTHRRYNISQPCPHTVPLISLAENSTEKNQNVNYANYDGYRWD